MKPYQSIGRSTWSNRRRRRRSGSILVWSAFLLVALIAMVGLVIDGGLMMAAYRQCHNAADAAALAAAMDLMLGRSEAEAAATAVNFVTDAEHNNLPDATVVVNVPPTQGPYAGSPDHVEAIVTYPFPTYFVHVVMPGHNRDQSVRAWAVAGFEWITAGEGVMALDPTAWPGLNVSGGGRIKILGRIIVNSEGGGVDENGDPSNMALLGHNKWGAKVGTCPLCPFGARRGVFAKDIQLVGGVDTPESFKNIDPLNPKSPLRCNGLPVPDPFANLPTPSTANGVDPTDWGTVKVTNAGLKQGPPSWEDPDTGEVTLQPGVYEQLTVTGGDVTLMPGIYVLSGSNNNNLSLTGGEVTGEGVMFYNTGADYNPNDGSPDAGDPPDPMNQSPPPKHPATDFGDVTLNASMHFFTPSMHFTPIDTETFSYPNPEINVFDGILFYQRRANPEPVRIEGSLQEGVLEGTIYAKWSHFTIAGQGTCNAQFIVGSIAVTGQGNVTIDYAGKDIAKVQNVFLVD